MTNTVYSTKVNTYAVQLVVPAVKANKVNTYAVELAEPALKTKKVNTYAVEQVKYGELYQDVSGDRPTYRAAPSGGIPYVDQSDTSASMKLRVPIAGYYTFIVYKDDQTFSTEEYELTQGENTLPITDNFNQIVVLKGRNIHRYTIRAIQEGMKERV